MTIVYCINASQEVCLTHFTRFPAANPSNCLASKRSERTVFPLINKTARTQPAAECCVTEWGWIMELTVLLIYYGVWFDVRARNGLWLTLSQWRGGHISVWHFDWPRSHTQVVQLFFCHCCPSWEHKTQWWGWEFIREAYGDWRWDQIGSSWFYSVRAQNNHNLITVSHVWLFVLCFF